MMTSFGRGRGWSNHQSQDRDQGLRRPGGGGGGGAFGSNKVLKDIVDKLVSHDEREGLPPQLIQEIVDLLTVAVNEDNLRHVCDSLWKQAIYHSLTTKLAMVFSDNRVALLEDNNKNSIRSRFLRFLQDNYMSKEKDRAEDRKIFANKILLHAEVYYHMRLNDGNRLKILAEPLIQYLEDLLQDNPKDNIYFIMIQLLRSGKDLFAACPGGLESLIMTIRQLLVKENLHNPENYAALLLVIELANNDYEIKDTRVKHFYFSNIKSLSFEHPFTHEELKVIATKTENDNKLQEVDNSQRIVREDAKNDVSGQGNYSKNSIPRAIRGSGASDKPKKGTNTKSNSLRTTPPRERNKAWGHDDRFHEHYE
ncbi:uncharacterized protein LOC112462783 [Temnothorax curvispinosus]|uniref:Uncharacterized protein LOC112462783 n=1 Tax=Temnothorax curvispinosus TaxID=300111 RepID=A0A6J1QQ07_9HYME|nr:uncharacterized protein LOC112462783 [Temnothorax curvispinosus]XP_024884571.1 uncharacterized protein LOC112462783 [Temnothorax curvispinosus]XP_024884572.1 uncharacterized protein LOC112462783 [Temnothorax curvispinosus]XP_024884573.1 uncharacterized protein LOC112462783 [Temnothorax curvispinosus]XP_024884574.1 uncharacterized protein LOC112462783 [Temnothorax curvispinosus]